MNRETIYNVLVKNVECEAAVITDDWRVYGALICRLEDYYRMINHYLCF